MRYSHSKTPKFTKKYGQPDTTSSNAYISHLINFCGRQEQPAKPNLQAVITQASHVCGQNSFGLPQRVNGIHRTQFDHLRLDPLSLVI